jgi:hypothetical protein
LVFHTELRVHRRHAIKLAHDLGQTTEDKAIQHPAETITVHREADRIRCLHPKVVSRSRSQKRKFDFRTRHFRRFSLSET